MELKRHYKGGEVHAVEVLGTGTDARQNWKRTAVMQWVGEGWMKVSADTITIKTIEGQPDLVYKILRKPGYYTEDGKPIPISELGLQQFFTEAVATIAPREAREWLAKNGRSGESYTATRNYECELDAEQHVQFASEAFLDRITKKG